MRLITFNKIICLFILFILTHNVFSQDKFTLSGNVTDATTGEKLVGVSVIIKEINGGSTTNLDGFYSINLAAGTYNLTYSYIGYQKTTKTVNLTKSFNINVALEQATERLEEVEILAEDENSSIDVQNIEMSVNKLDIKVIKKLPALMGEVDIVKSLQFLPGVSSVGEGSSGFNVRGGSVGQNLVLMDQAPLYNSSHMLGFFSVFNPDAVEDVKLYKGGIPADYGGRLSSVLDVNLKEGNLEKTEVNGGVGVIFSRLAVETPIVKNKGSVLVAARRSYIDGLTALFDDDFEGLGLNFYDLTLKSNYKLGNKSTIYLSGFLGKDNFGFAEDGGFSWGNKTGTLRWNYKFNDRFQANVSAVLSNYEYQLSFEEDEENTYDWTSSITNYKIKPDFNYFISENSELSFGVEGNYYNFEPSTTYGTNDGEFIDTSLDRKYASESAAYLSHQFKIFDAIEVKYGLRVSNFRLVGPGSAAFYNDTIPGLRRTVVEEKSYNSGETIASYTTPEPRLAIKVGLNNNESIKMSYNRMAQYIHFISNSTASNPLNIWTPSSNNLKPTVGDQFALGYFKAFNHKENDYEFSAEVFYKKSENEVDYINGAELLGNEYLEGELLSGLGRSYGLELYLQKKTGTFTGWVSYTLSRSELKVDGINNGDWYLSRYDQLHNLKVVGSYKFNGRWTITSDFAFATGTPTTFPNQKYISQGIVIPYNSGNTRNNVRLSPYHRLDLSLRMEGKTHKNNGKKRKVKDYWVFSIYNVYAHQNAFSIYFTQSDYRVSTGQVLGTEAHKVSIIGTMVPSFSYNFNF
ncbi:TonB-dependent receptor [Chondrinema litorale]|uniref:TonB-dependent receptor n=1 Tax=Chondrinema litorale TaxID=2994555 RepID=UPI002542F5A1|nr:carboxypeptidase-like regulatory domain-containing protein [Chondrinema litorale]UZR97232.1 carboxypeptidase-like regulatory domain-containing protein [Chondrinema litorale]